MAAVGVAGRVGVVLEQVDLAGDALVVQPLLGVDEQALEDALPGPVVRDEIGQGVALGRRVLRVGADVEVEAGAVAQEDVAGAPPRHDPAEQVARYLVRRQPSLAAVRARNAVLRSRARRCAGPCHDSSLHSPAGKIIQQVRSAVSVPATPRTVSRRSGGAGRVAAAPEVPGGRDAGTGSDWLRHCATSPAGCHRRSATSHAVLACAFSARRAASTRRPPGRYGPQQAAARTDRPARRRRPLAVAARRSAANRAQTRATSSTAVDAASSRSSGDTCASRTPSSLTAASSRLDDRTITRRPSTRGSLREAEVAAAERPAAAGSQAAPMRATAVPRR